MTDRARFFVMGIDKQMPGTVRVPLWRSMPAADTLNPSTITVSPLLTARDIARVLGISERTLWRLVSKSRGGHGGFPKPLRLGGHAVRWRWQDIEKYLQDLAQK